MNNHINELQSVDIALGSVITRAYEGLAGSGTNAWRRFLERPNETKIYRVDNEDPRTLLRRIAEQKKDGRPLPDLPVIGYYRSPGLVGDMNEKPRAFNITRYTDDTERALCLTTIPVTLSYSLLFCAWDKPTLDKLCVAWFCYIGRFGRRHSRFIVQHKLGEEPVEIPASISATRDILVDNAGIDQAEGRLWAARTLVEVNTQVLYGREIIDPAIRVFGTARVR